MERVEGKKRKQPLAHNNEEDYDIINEEEENEEEKMERFYALVKSLREARDRLINGSSALKEMEERRKKRKLLGEHHAVGQVAHACGWKPSFQREDFMPEADRCHLLNASARSEVAKKEEVREAIDLRLSL